MPPLALLRRPTMSSGRMLGMSALRLCLAVAMTARAALVLTHFEHGYIK